MSLHEIGTKYLLEYCSQRINSQQLAKVLLLQFGSDLVMKAIAPSIIVAWQQTN